MISITRAAIFCLVVVLSARAASAPDAEPAAAPAEPAPVPDAAALKKLSARFAPVDLAVDIQALPAAERAALAKLIEAAKVMDALFLRQVWAGNETLLLDLTARSQRRSAGPACTPSCRTRGPGCGWTTIGRSCPAWARSRRRANFYPAGASKARSRPGWRTLPRRRAPAAEGFFTTIRRTPDGKLQVVPYSLEYQGELARAAALLREAAALTSSRRCARSCEARAAAFLSNDYYDSDVAWMKLDASIEPTIGPYEVYEDGWFNAKAAFEAFVTLRDDAETAKLAKFAGELQDIENHLPIDAEAAQPEDRARWPPSGWSTSSSARATPTAACRPPRSTCPTTSASARRWAPSARC